MSALRRGPLEHERPLLHPHITAGQTEQYGVANRCELNLALTIVASLARLNGSLGSRSPPRTKTGVFQPHCAIETEVKIQTLDTDPCIKRRARHHNRPLPFKPEMMTLN